MPRMKKPAGQAVDRRNGRREELPAVVVENDAKPPRPKGLCIEARRQWDAFWESPAASIMTPADRGVVLRWIDAVDRYMRLLGDADRQPLVTGSTGQKVANPLYAIADKALATVKEAERQLGIGALNRSQLGIAVITERRSLADMNSRYGSADEQPDEPDQGDDPRLHVVEGDVV